MHDLSVNYIFFLEFFKKKPNMIRSVQRLDVLFHYKCVLFARYG